MSTHQHPKEHPILLPADKLPPLTGAQVADVANAERRRDADEADGFTFTAQEWQAISSGARVRVRDMRAWARAKLAKAGAK